MPTLPTKSGFVTNGNAQLYYETAGTGTPFVMIHAGVADSRQWDNEFAFFGQEYQVVRYDMRGYGKSEPVDGEFSHMDDLTAVLNALELHEPVILMGCSMGGGLAMDFALAHPSRVRASFTSAPILPENFLSVASGSRERSTPLRSASRTARATMPCASRNGTPLRTR